jgi:hypothetical protein
VRGMCGVGEEGMEVQLSGFRPSLGFHWIEVRAWVRVGGAGEPHLPGAQLRMKLDASQEGGGGDLRRKWHFLYDRAHSQG